MCGEYCHPCGEYHNAEQSHFANPRLSHACAVHRFIAASIADERAILSGEFERGKAGAS